MNSGTIVLVEDDVDDKDVVVQVLKELEMDNEVRWFPTCQHALQYLKSSSEPLLVILSDVNLPGQSGMEFKKEIDNDPKLRRKSIPFVFYSTSVAHQTVDKAYTEMTVQGFFQKGNSYEEIKDTIKLILQYWKVCRHPNTK